MTTGDLIQVGSALLSLAAIVFSVGSYFQRLRVVEKAQAKLEAAFQRFLDTCALCKKDHSDQNSDIHARITAVNSDVNFLKGIEEGERRHAK